MRHDEVIVCTLPGQSSKWLRGDLPHAVARHTGVSVLHVVAHDPEDVPHVARRRSTRRPRSGRSACWPGAASAPRRRHDRGAGPARWGSSACTSVPAPGGLSTTSSPSSAATRSAIPLRPLPAPGSAPPMPSSRTSITTRPLLDPQRDLGLARRRVLGDVRERLADEEVGGALELRREPLRRASPVTVTGTGARAARPGQRRLEAALGQHRRVDAARELAQLGQPLLELLDRGVEQGRGPRVRRRPTCAPSAASARARRGAAGRRRAGRARSCGARRRPRRPAGRARRAAPRSGRAARRRGARCAARAPAAAPGGAHELGLLEQRRVVHDRRDAAAVVLDLGHRPRRSRRGQLDGAAVGVDVAARVAAASRRA